MVGRSRHGGMRKDLPDGVVGPWLIGIGLIVAVGFVALSLVVATDQGLLILGALIFLGLAAYGGLLLVFDRQDRRRRAALYVTTPPTDVQDVADDAVSPPRGLPRDR